MDEEHYSTTLPSGSRTFLVEGRRFILPKAILARNSEVFLGITPDEEITKLDDHAEAFEDFVDILFDPFTSCLLQPEPSLRKILHVLQISNKYCCDTIEGRARPLAIQMTTGATLKSHIGPLLSAVEVFRIAVKASLLTYHDAWELIMGSFKEQKMTARGLIDEARRSGMSKFVGAAFYEVMISGRKKWSTDESLSLSERQVLMKGMLSCVDDWDAFAMRLASGSLQVPCRILRNKHSGSQNEGMMDTESPDSDGDNEIYIVTEDVKNCRLHVRRQYNEELATISQIHALHRIPTYDIIRRLACIQESLPPVDKTWGSDRWNYPSHLCSHCWRDVVSCAARTNTFIKESRLPFYFIER